MMQENLKEENTGHCNPQAKDPDQKTNLIINYLPQTFLDADLRRVFSSIGEVVNAKVMRDKKTGYSYGFGFVNYAGAEDAKRAIEGLNGLEIKGKRIKVSFARPPGEERKDTNLYVSYLPKNITDAELTKMFEPYGTIVQTNLLRDKNTGLTRGVGFVRYDRKEEAYLAIENLNGMSFPTSMQPLSVKIAEEHGKMKASYFAGMQAGKSMAIGNAYGGFGGAYPEGDESGYGGFGNYGAGYGAYDASGYGGAAPPPPPRFPPAGPPYRASPPGFAGARPMMGTRPPGRPPLPPGTGGPMKSRMQGQNRYNPIGGWPDMSGGGYAGGWTAQ